MATTNTQPRTGIDFFFVSHWALQHLQPGESIRVTRTWKNVEVDVFGRLTQLEHLPNQIAINMTPLEVYEKDHFPFNPNNLPVQEIPSHRWASMLGWKYSKSLGTSDLRFGWRKSLSIYRMMNFYGVSTSSNSTPSSPPPPQNNANQQKYANVQPQDHAKDLNDLLHKMKNRRQEFGYNAQRHTLAVARDEVKQAFDLVTLNVYSSFEEFKARRRELMKIWHTDKSSFSNLSEDEFKNKSMIITNALARVEQYINARDNRNQTRNQLPE